MQRADKTVISNIIAVYPYIYGWQDEIEKRQEVVLSDMVSPAKKIVAELIRLDNMRIDLCNLKVLYAFMERGLGADFAAFTELARSEIDGAKYEVAASCIERAGYTLDRARRDFDYLFRRIKPKRGKRKAVPAMGDYAARLYV